MPGLRSLAGRSVLFALGGFAQKAVGIVLVPVLARTLTVADFGRLEVLSVLSSTLSVVCLLGLDIVVTRRWADVDQAVRRRTFATWLALTAVLGAAVAAVGIAAGPAISDALFGRDDHAAAIGWLGVGVLANLVLLVGLTALRNEDRPRAYAVVAVTAAVTNGVLVIVLVRAERDVAAVLAGGACALAIGAVASILATRSVTVGPPSRAELATLLVAAGPLVPGIVLTAGGELASRFIVLGAAGARQVAYLSLSMRFAAIGLLLLVGFQLAWHPRAYAIAPSEQGTAHLRRDARALLLALAALAVVLAALGPELLDLAAGARYGAALPALGWALLVPAATGMLMVTTLPLTIGHQMRGLGAATAAAAVASVLLTLALSPTLGAAGAVAALAAGPAVGALTAARLTAARGLPSLTNPVAVLPLAVTAAVVLGLTLPAPAPPLGLRLAAMAAVLGGLGRREHDLVLAGRRFLGSAVRRQRR